MKKTEQFSGYVLFVLQNKGSKSENYSPVLMQENVVIAELYFENDNPRTNQNLRKFHTNFCKIEGVFDVKSNLLTVSEISKIDDPVMKLWAKSEENIDETNLKMEADNE